MDKLGFTNSVTIRTELRPGDLDQVIQIHGNLYLQEYQFGPAFQEYVARGLQEFYTSYDPLKDRVWICENNDSMVGFLLLMHRPDRLAQLRFFILLPEYRGIGLGKQLMDRFMGFLEEANYRGAFLWTTHEQLQAAALYTRYGFRLTEEKESVAFGKPLKEQRYDFRSHFQTGSVDC